MNTQTQNGPAQTKNRKENVGFSRILNAFRFSCKGFRSAYKNEAAFRQEIAIAAILLPAAFILSDSRWELLALIVSIIFVLIVELLNSSIEAVVDRIGLEHHELSGRAKDMGSAAVLLSGIIWALTWGTVLLS
ncbi:Prokaryotic diacylglycerol kinase superfamily [Verrucomicrobiia bacterium DG1235]|nr:Prokaryotic diacylglycerol kinase superfamily [Verrucomicrobiae bacterium DG1235]